MKQKIKKTLEYLGVIEYARFLYGNIRLLNPSRIGWEMFYRIKGLPDKYPYPPSKLIFLVIGHGFVSEYYRSGKIIVDEMIKELRDRGIDLQEKQNILDFGCGSGRMLRHFIHLKNSRLHGSDYNKELTDWCSENLKFGKFIKNNLTPPIDYADNYFDFIYARSVFTHMGAELQIEWMKEINRILNDGGIFYFTTHGADCMRGLDEDQKKKFLSGELVAENLKIEGDNKCSSYESKEFVENNLLNGFRLIEFIPGGKSDHLKQDTYIVEKLRRR